MIEHRLTPAAELAALARNPFPNETPAYRTARRTLLAR